MTTRVLIGSLAIAAVLGIVGLDAGIARNAPLSSALLARGSFIPLVLALLSALGSLELAALLRRAGHAPYFVWATTCCMALVLVPWVGPSGLLGSSMCQSALAQLAVLSAAFLGTGCIAVLRRDVHGGLINSAATGLIIIYTGLFPSFLIMLRCDLPGEHGAWIVLAIVLICKFCDIGAYFAGSTLGRHKLIPAVSPKKSIEGMVGGIVASCSVALLFWWVHQIANPATSTLTSSLGEWLHATAAIATTLFDRLSATQALIFGALMAVVGQLGDLVESVFKRTVGAKDSAALLPSFGGILDLLDSPIAAAPVAWIVLTFVWAAV